MSHMIDYATIGDLSKYDITIENHNSGSVTFTSGTWKETYRSTGGQYPIGTILLMYAYATFTGNSTGDRGIVIRTTTADAASTVLRAPSASGVAARVSTSWEIAIGSDTSTFGVAGYQSSGGDLTGVVYLRIVVLTPKS